MEHHDGLHALEVLPGPVLLLQIDAQRVGAGAPARSMGAFRAGADLSVSTPDTGSV